MVKELGQPIFEVFFTERYKSIEDNEMVHRNNFIMRGFHC